jgi:L-threonylcarbamoyladenylate synthase
MDTVNMTFQEDILAAVAVMKNGGVILYPTDTVWGIGCDATCADAVRKVYDIKHRTDSKALISLVSGMDELKDYVGEIPDTIVALLENSPRPTTVVYPICRNLAKGLMADDGSAAFRITSEAYSGELCRQLGSPVVSTSANISGETAPAIFREISQEIISAVDYVASYRRDDMALASPSRVMKVNSDGSTIILRP